jgi:hypothetical protein
MGNFPYASSYLVHGAGLLPAYPVRAVYFFKKKYMLKSTYLVHGAGLLPAYPVRVVYIYILKSPLYSDFI